MISSCTQLDMLCELVCKHWSSLEGELGRLCWNIPLESFCHIRSYLVRSQFVSTAVV